MPCPPGFTALNGFFSGDPTSRVTESLPAADGSAWTFAVEQASAQDMTGAAQAQCLRTKTGKAKGHTHKLQVAHVEQQVPVPSSFTGPQQQQTVLVDGTGQCSNGFFPVGIGYAFPGHPNTTLSSFVPQGAKRSKGGTRSRARPSRGFLFQILNNSTEQTATIVATCLRAKTSNGA